MILDLLRTNGAARKLILGKEVSMNINVAKKIVEDYVKKSSGVKSHAIFGFEVKDGYVFSLRPDKWPKDEVLMDPFLPKDEVLMDPFFKVSANGKVTEYSPVMDPKEFREGMQNRIKFER